MTSGALIAIFGTVLFLAAIAAISWFKGMIQDGAVTSASLAQMTTALAASEKARQDDVTRLQALIDSYKARLKEAEGEMLRCQDPDERVRRLRELFS